jgi:hypothetical protein
MLIKRGDAKILHIVKEKELEDKTASEVLDDSIKKDSKEKKVEQK